MDIDAYRLAETWIGVREIPGKKHNPQIVAWIQEAGGTWIEDDETAWCSAFMFTVAKRLRLPVPESGRLRARSWLRVGTPVPWGEWKVGFDVAVLKRGGGNQPGPDVLDAQGHVGLYAGHSLADPIHGDTISLLAGNQGNEVCVARFPLDRLLDVRRLSP